MTDLSKKSVAELRETTDVWWDEAFDELARRLEEAQGAIKGYIALKRRCDFCSTFTWLV